MEVEARLAEAEQEILRGEIDDVLPDPEAHRPPDQVLYVVLTESLEEALKKRFSPKSLDGMTLPATGLNGDIHASPEYRAHLIVVMAKRAVTTAIGK